MRLQILPVLALLAGGAGLARSQAVPGPSPTRTEQRVMTGIATGGFDVKLTPQPAHSAGGGAGLGRMTIDKQFHGDLEAVSTGEMLSAMTRVKGSAGYVAVEVVQGTLAGRTGSFVLQHHATMHRGAASLSVSVVPDSGTDGLEGLSGEMTILVDGRNHSYQFAYSLPEGPR